MENYLPKFARRQQSEEEYRRFIILVEFVE